MNVPIMGETVPIQAPGRFGPETPRIAPIGAESSGTNIAAASADTGRIVEGMGLELSAHIKAKQDFDNEQKSNDAATAALNDLHDVHDELTQKQGVNAEGNYDILLARKSEFKAKYAKGLTPEQADHYNRVFDNGAEVIGRSVSQHEAEQTQVAREQGIASRIKTGADIYAINPYDSHSQAALDKAISDAGSLSQIHGETSETSAIRKQGVYDAFVLNAATKNPANASMLLEKHGTDISQKAQEQLRGIQVDSLQNNIIEEISSGSAKVLNTDATPSLEKTLSFVDAQAKAQKFTPEQTAQAEAQARSLISTKTAEINQNREQNQKKFSDSALQMFNSGKGHDEMVDALVKKSNFDFSGYPTTDKSNQKDYIDKLFTDKESAIQDALTHLNPSQKAAIAEAEIVVDGKVGNTKITLAGDKNKQQPAKEVYMNLVKRYVAGSNHTYKEIMQYTNDLSKDLGKGHFWSFTVPAFKSVEEQKQAESLTSKLETPIDRIRVKKNTGETGSILIKDFDPKAMEKI